MVETSTRTHRLDAFTVAPTKHVPFFRFFDVSREIGAQFTQPRQDFHLPDMPLFRPLHGKRVYEGINNVPALRLDQGSYQTEILGMKPHRPGLSPGAIITQFDSHNIAVSLSVGSSGKEGAEDTIWCRFGMVVPQEKWTYAPPKFNPDAWVHTNGDAMIGIHADGTISTAIREPENIMDTISPTQVITLISDILSGNQVTNKRWVRRLATWSKPLPAAE
jgi:hypothetical protein